MLCEQIRDLHRQRCFAMDQRKRNDLALGAFLRTQLGWSRNLPEAERAAIAKQAMQLLKKPEGEWAEFIVDAKSGADIWVKREKAALKLMEKLAKELPVWQSFGADIRGFGAASLAVIVGEAGDLSNYATHSKLWKRMGLAVMDGIRQGGLAKGAGAEAWIEHGYNPVRRSQMWNIGDTIIKGNRDGYYRTVYLDRKAFELARDPEMQPMKAHRRAQRYLEKRLLKRLWQAWRGAIVDMAGKPERLLPHTEIRDAA